MQKGIVVFLIFGLLAFFTSGCGSSSGIGSSGSGSSYSVVVTVSGLAGTGLTLQNNGADDLPIDSDGDYVFTADIADGASYDITVATRPSSPDQFCNVYEHSGTINGADATDIEVKCFTGRFNIVDTGQRTCYDSVSGDPAACSGAGYDADYTGN